MAGNNEIPENAVKVLFAQDLMNLVMTESAGTSYTPMTAERYRDFIYNAFTEIIADAVVFLYYKVDTENKKIFIEMLQEDSVNIVTYTIYAETLREKYTTDGFDARGFLHYCVRLTGVAVQFYGHGVVEAPGLAVTYIVNALDNVDMTTGAWVTLNIVAKSFANIEIHTVRQISPRHTSDEETSSSSGDQNMDSPERKKDLNESNGCCSRSSVNSSNFEENKVLGESSSPDTFAPGTSNTTGMSVCSMKDVYLDLPLKEINHDSAQTEPPQTSEKESGILGETSKCEKHNSDSEETNFPNKES